MGRKPNCYRLYGIVELGSGSYKETVLNRVELTRDLQEGSPSSWTPWQLFRGRFSQGDNGIDDEP